MGNSAGMFTLRSWGDGLASHLGGSSNDPSRLSPRDEERQTVYSACVWGGGGG